MFVGDKLSGISLDDSMRVDFQSGKSLRVDLLNERQSEMDLVEIAVDGVGSFSIEPDGRVAWERRSS